MPTNCPAINADLVVRDILAPLPGASDALVRIELFNAVREFCEKSLAVRGDTEDVISIGDNELVLADTPEGLRVIKVLFLRGPNGPIWPRPWSRAVAVNSSGAMGNYYCPEPNRIVFDTLATEAVAINAIVALSPPRQCIALPAVVYEQYYEAIKAGTLGRLHGQMSKPYSNASLAVRFMARNTALITQARYTAEQENTMGEPGFRYPKFGL